MSSATTRRTRSNPMGDTTLRNNVKASAVAVRWCLGMLLGVVRRIVWVAEQPSSSVLLYLPCVRFLMNINMAGFGYPASSLVRLKLGS